MEQDMQLHKNLSAWVNGEADNRKEGLWERLCAEAAAEEVQPISLPARDGSRLLVLERSSGQVRLNSPYRPSVEAQTWAEQFSFATEEPICMLLFGLGNGSFARALRARLRPCDRLYVWEPSCAVTVHVLREYELSELLGAASVLLVCGRERLSGGIAADGARAGVEQSAALQMAAFSASLQIRTAVHPQYDKLFPELYAAFLRETEALSLETEAEDIGTIVLRLKEEALSGRSTQAGALGEQLYRALAREEARLLAGGEREALLVQLRQLIAQLPPAMQGIRLLLASFLADISGAETDMLALLQLPRLSGYTKENRLYLWHQINGLAFRKPVLKTPAVKAELRALYQEIFEEYRAAYLPETLFCEEKDGTRSADGAMVANKGRQEQNEIEALDGKRLERYEIEAPDGRLCRLPASVRDANFVLVTVGQFLTENHAPTRTTLERCELLVSKLHKQVLLYNTRELLTEAGSVLLWHSSQVMKAAQYDDCEVYSYHGMALPFYQVRNSIFEPEEFARLLHLVLERKPYYILNIGGASIATDLLAQLVPVLSVATVFSEFPVTRAQFSVVGRTLDAAAWAEARRYGLRRVTAVREDGAQMATDDAMEVDRALTTDSAEAAAESVQMATDGAAEVDSALTVDSTLTADSSAAAETYVGEVIESVFTFEMRQQQKKLSRKALSIPETAFVLAVVGARLTADVTEEFIAVMSRTFCANTFLAFAGKMEQYDTLCERFPALKERSVFVGFQDDILAFYEICDLYVNPYRAGGGFSVIEAFHMGKPGVTIAFGDVAAAAGAEFCVKDYDEMVTWILRYAREPQFYRDMQKKAAEREAIVTDGARALREIAAKMEGSALFF